VAPATEKVALQVRRMTLVAWVSATFFWLSNEGESANFPPVMEFVVIKNGIQIRQLLLCETQGLDWSGLAPIGTSSDIKCQISLGSSPTPLSLKNLNCFCRVEPGEVLFEGLIVDHVARDRSNMTKIEDPDDNAERGRVDWLLRFSANTMSIVSKLVSCAMPLMMVDTKASDIPIVVIMRQNGQEEEIRRESELVRNLVLSYSVKSLPRETSQRAMSTDSYINRSETLETTTREAEYWRMKILVSFSQRQTSTLICFPVFKDTLV
ncbi:hypothetical protein BGZ65_003043, partial [Modicella reniformis]